MCPRPKTLGWMCGWAFLAFEEGCPPHHTLESNGFQKQSYCTASQLTSCFNIPFDNLITSELHHIYICYLYLYYIYICFIYLYIIYSIYIYVYIHIFLPVKSLQPKKFTELGTPAPFSTMISGGTSGCGW